MSRKSQMPARIEKAKERLYLNNGKPSILQELETKFDTNIKDYSVFRDLLKRFQKEFDRLPYLKFGESQGFVPPSNKNYNTATKGEVNRYFLSIVEDYFKKGNKPTATKSSRQEVIDANKKVEPQPSKEPSSFMEALTNLAERVTILQEQVKEIDKDVKEIKEVLNASKEHEIVQEVTPRPSPVESPEAKKLVEPEEPEEPEEEKVDRKYRELIAKLTPASMDEVRWLIHEEMESTGDRDSLCKIIAELMDREEEEVKDDFKSLSNKGILDIFFKEVQV